MDTTVTKIVKTTKALSFFKKRPWIQSQWVVILLAFLGSPTLLWTQVQINCVPGFPISCASDIIVDVNAPFTSTNCTSSPNVTVSVSGPVINGNNGCPGTTYTYTYTATDMCNQSASCQQVFTIANNIGPFITSLSLIHI